MSKYIVMNLNTGVRREMDEDAVFEVYSSYLNKRLFKGASAVTIVTGENEFLRFVPVEESE